MAPIMEVEQYEYPEEHDPNDFNKDESYCNGEHQGSGEYEYTGYEDYDPSADSQGYYDENGNYVYYET